MSNNDHGTHNKKRNRDRWGSNLAAEAEGRSKDKNSTLDEDEALAALMASAQKRMEEKRTVKETFNKHNNLPPSHQNDDKRQKTRYSNERRSHQREVSSQGRWGNKHENDSVAPSDAASEPPPKKVKADFGLSGALAEDTQTGNTYNGVVLKFSEPPEARTPNTRWRLYVFRGGENIEVLHIAKQSAYLFGREKDVADILVEHPSLSRQHCVLQYRAIPDKNDSTVVRCRPYLMDLGSAHGTFINGTKIEDARYYELRKKDIITLGASSREYILLTENSS